MPIVNGIGTTWNLPNYYGDLFTADPEHTPFLAMIGGLTGGMSTNSFKFVTNQLFNHPEPTQPEISESASVIAPPASHIARIQEYNVVQIHQEVIDLTYAKMSNSGFMSGLNIAGQTPNPPTEKDWQLSQKLVKIARDVEHSFIAGIYQEATNAGVANKTRGMIELTKSANGTSIDADDNPLTLEMLNTLYRLMVDNGALFQNPVMFVNSKLKQDVTKIYNMIMGFALPATRNVGGLDIREVEFDFGRLGIAHNRFMPVDTLLIADVAYCSPVFQVVPEKGVFFTEPLAKVGASDREQIYGQIGLDHGPAFLHGSITGLK